MFNAVSSRLSRSCVVSRSRTFGAALLVSAMLSGAASAAQIVITSTTNWTVPGDWNNADNSIEAIGGGGGGGGSVGAQQGAGGGGGGEYRKASNVSLTPGASIAIVIGSGGAGGTTGPSNGSAGTATIFGGSMVVANPGQGGAASGTVTSGAAAGGAGGVGAAAHFDGGPGGARLTLTAGAGAGGGGAGGPNGPGATGGSSAGAGPGAAGGGAANGGAAGGIVPSSENGAAGGNNSAGSGGGTGGIVGVVSSVGDNGGGGAGSNGAGGGGGGGRANSVTGRGGAGGAGLNWNTVGAGGGGGGGGAAYTTVAGAGGPGGSYGGGGGGAGSSTFAGNVGGAGAPGFVVITYTPATGTSNPPGENIFSITRTSSFSYDAGSGLLTQEVVEPDTPAVRLQTDYVYDAFGNKQSATVSGIGIATRSSASSYDSKGQFVSSNTNALGQSESFQYDARFGQPTSHTGPNGLTTTFSYDELGRKIQEVRADGTQTKWSYQFCSGVNGGTVSCVAGAVYAIVEMSYAADGTTQNAPVTTVFFDALEREIARRTQGFDGSTIQATKAYDALGRVAQTSRPYFLSGGTPQYTTFTYDALGRVVTTTLPDGSVSQVAYHGLSVTETNALNQTRTTVKDSQSKVVSITDALGNTMRFAYDAVGNLVQTTDAVGNVVTATYDVRGRKIASSDPDLGNWTYTYNVLGLLVSQTDAKAQSVTLTYDKLNRLVQRVEPDVTSVWTYDTAANGVGKLASSNITAGSGSGFARSFSYDSLGRSSQVATTIDGTTYVMGAVYDANSRLIKVSYPSGFTGRYGYNSLGFANQLQDDTSAQSYWTANAMDAEGHLTQQTAGNGLVTTRGFDLATGRLTSISTGVNNAVQNLSFTYDRLGGVLGRNDANTNVSEIFTYDALNRLTSSTVNLNPAPLVKTFAYDPIGNITSKSDVGTYIYPASSAPLPHAVMSTSGGTISATFTYDANGNQTSGLGRSIVYTSYNKPASITQGTRTISFVDDTEHQRFKQVTPEGTTLYIAAFGVLAEVNNPGTTTQKWTDYLSVGNAKVGMRVTQTASETLTTRYFHTDHLGSISVLTDENGIVQERLSYDAWGRRRNPNGTDDVAGSITSQTTRGFTGEEELSTGGLVHLNGRVYDPLLARFTSADPTVTDPTNSQGWNRYSYVGNDPLVFTDPSGFDFISNVFGSIANFISGVARAIGSFIQNNLASILQIAITTFLSATGVFAPIAAFVGAAVATGLTGGNLGQVLRVGALAAATAFAFAAVGGATNAVAAGNMDAFSLTSHSAPGFGTPEYAFNVAGHALVGCASSAASGGDCKSGALSAGVSSAAGPFINGKNYTQSLVSNAVVGGLASVAGGGKFGNGAVTAAFGYLFNTAAAALRWGTIGANVGGVVFGIAGSETGPADVLLIGAGRLVVGGLFAAVADWATGPDVVLTEQSPGEIKKSIRSLEKNIQEHQDKLDAYKEDPDKFDNNDWLKNAPSPEVRDRIIQGRILHLEGEIANWQKKIEALKGKL
ncbi:MULTISPECIES: RHS repeat-associated core domain-containing protein [unclassified Bradyrhizobium]|uniref:RHS repeat domain-containing protein n=1 Tax=unclassified Bradyrhizobium TaxID=2631580 RepID=UPI0028EEB182|nr:MULTISPECIES: RHS repeat-associated core domain-containing protein [unclassified Bradyrhizobium]